MTLSTRARLTGGALAGSALSVITAGAGALSGAGAAAPTRVPVAYGISATGAAPISATPIVRSPDGALRTDTGTARSSDGTISIGSATVSTSRGQASAVVTAFRAFDGLVTAARVTATCDNGFVTSRADGPTPGPLGRKGSIAYAVRRTNDDGSSTIIGMQVRVAGAAGVPASTINVASATCATNPASPSPSSSVTSTPPSTQPPMSRPPSSRPPTSRPATSAPPGPSPSSPRPTTTAPPAQSPPAQDPPAPAPDAATANPTAQPLPDSRRLPPAPKATPRKTHLPVTG